MVSYPMMNLLAVAVSITLVLLLGLALVTVRLRWKKPLEVSNKDTDLTTILNSFTAVQRAIVQVDRSVRDEISRNRQEQANLSQALRAEVTTSLTAIGDSVSGKVESLTRTNDQRLELLRSGMEQRLDSFTLESGRKIDNLTQSIAGTSTMLQNEVAVKLSEFKNALAETGKETHQRLREQTESISGTLRTLQSNWDEKQLGLHTLMDTKLATMGQQTGQKLSDVETTLRNGAQQLREETGAASTRLGDSVLTTLTGISQLQKNELRELRTTIDGRLAAIQAENEKKLEQMRQTVDEKLQGTLDARLGESFKQVSDHLEQVYKGLGEMQSLAAGVGDLKRVLTNVKTRGTWGEVQLGAILEQMLAPDQYGKNVATSGTGERVEYAIKLPGRDNNDSPVWLPIDAKFPVEDYQRLVNASEICDVEAIGKASRQLDATLKLCARSLNEKYLAPPLTTDFGILFLSTEGLFAEVNRRDGLAEFIQREYRIVMAGPSTLAALLNSFQMGFRTLAIQQRSSEVFELLGAVRSEFTKYAGVLAKVRKKLNEAQNTIEKAETRTRAIRRKLGGIEGSDNFESIGAATPRDYDIEDATVLIGVGEED